MLCWAVGVDYNIQNVQIINKLKYLIIKFSDVEFERAEAPD